MLLQAYLYSVDESSQLPIAVQTCHLSHITPNTVLTSRPQRYLEKVDTIKYQSFTIALSKLVVGLRFLTKVFFNILQTSLARMAGVLSGAQETRGPRARDKPLQQRPRSQAAAIGGGMASRGQNSGSYMAHLHCHAHHVV